MYCFLKYTKVPVLSISTLVFSFYHLSSQNPQLVYTPSHLLVQYTRMGGGRRKLPTTYFIHICDLASIRIFMFSPVPELLAKKLTRPAFQSSGHPPKILWGGGMLPSRLHVFWATWPHPFSTCLELSSHLNN